MATSIAKSVLDDSISQFKSSRNEQKSKVNWDDFNYPPLIKVIHYDIDEVEPEQRLVVRALWLSHILIALYSLVNIIDNCIQAGYGADGIRILYSFMFLFSFNPIQWYGILQNQSFIFYRGYKGVVTDPFLLTLYKWIQIVLILCWITFSIVDFLGFNGFVALPALFDYMPFCGVLALLEDIMLLLVSLLSGYSLFRIWGIRN